MALTEVVGTGHHSCEHPGRKCQKYCDIPSAYTFLPTAMDTFRTAM